MNKGGRGGQAAILFIGFLLGAALMGVEMAAIRMMTPYFGSAIEIWACMIATVMLSMMAGYYVGRSVADRAPRSEVLGGFVLAAGLFVLALPFSRPRCSTGCSPISAMRRPRPLRLRRRCFSCQ